MSGPVLTLDNDGGTQYMIECVVELSGILDKTHNKVETRVKVFGFPQCPVPRLLYWLRDQIVHQLDGETKTRLDDLTNHGLIVYFDRGISVHGDPDAIQRADWLWANWIKKHSKPSENVKGVWLSRDKDLGHYFLDFHNENVVIKMTMALFKFDPPSASRRFQEQQIIAAYADFLKSHSSKNQRNYQQATPFRPRFGASVSTVLAGHGGSSEASGQHLTGTRIPGDVLSRRLRISPKKMAPVLSKTPAATTSLHSSSSSALSLGQKAALKVRDETQTLLRARINHLINFRKKLAKRSPFILEKYEVGSMAFQLKHLIRCHSSNDQYASNDVTTAVNGCSLFHVKEKESPVVVTVGGNKICFIDCESGKVEGNLVIASDELYCVSTVQITSPETTDLENHKKVVLSESFAPAKSLENFGVRKTTTIIATAGKKGNILLISYEDQKCFSSINNSERSLSDRQGLSDDLVVNDVELSIHTNTSSLILLSAGSDSVKLWNLSSQQQKAPVLHLVTLPTSRSSSRSVSPDSSSRKASNQNPSEIETPEYASVSTIQIPSADGLSSRLVVAAVGTNIFANLTLWTVEDRDLSPSSQQTKMIFPVGSFQDQGGYHVKFIKSSLSKDSVLLLCQNSLRSQHLRVYRISFAHPDHFEIHLLDHLKVFHSPIPNLFSKAFVSSNDGEKALLFAGDNNGSIEQFDFTQMSSEITPEEIKSDPSTLEHKSRIVLPSEIIFHMASTGHFLHGAISDDGKFLIATATNNLVFIWALSEISEASLVSPKQIRPQKKLELPHKKAEPRGSPSITKKQTKPPPGPRGRSRKPENEVIAPPEDDEEDEWGEYRYFASDDTEGNPGAHQDFEFADDLDMWEMMILENENDEITQEIQEDIDQSFADDGQSIDFDHFIDYEDAYCNTGSENESDDADDLVAAEDHQDQTDLPMKDEETKTEMEDAVADQTVVVENKLEGSEEESEEYEDFFMNDDFE